jgi:hypothetical protein
MPTLQIVNFIKVIDGSYKVIFGQQKGRREKGRAGTSGGTNQTII